MYDNFDVILRPLTLEEVSDIVSYDASDVVANITDEEFLDGLKSQHQYEQEELTRGLLDDLLRNYRSNHVQKPKKQASQTRQKLTLKPKKIYQASGKLSQFRKRVQNQHRLNKPVLGQRNDPAPSVSQSIKRSKVPLKQLPTIKPLKDDFLDLLPPDSEELGVEMDKLLLATPENEELESDSISLMSSDESYYDFDDQTHIEIIGQQLEKSDSRPGLKLDLDLYAPPSRDAIKSLPNTPMFECGNPRCGFSTSNQTKIQLHSNVHSRASESRSS